MGTRYFSPVEEKDSRIKWERADANTAPKLALAINKYAHGIVSAKVARIIVFLPGVILLVLLGGYLILLRNNYVRLVSDIEGVFYILFALLIVFFSIFLLVRYIKFRPYLYPERQPCIWMFRTKCYEVSTMGIGSDKRYCAHFQKGGGHISIRLTYSEYKMNPTGNEYIFYKFSNQTGTRWSAIPADKLDEF